MDEQFRMERDSHLKLVAEFIHIQGLHKSGQLVGWEYIRRLSRLWDEIDKHVGEHFRDYVLVGEVGDSLDRWMDCLNARRFRDGQ